MVHRRLDVALGAQVLRAVVIEIVVARREVRVERVEVAGLLDAVPNRRELIGKVLATGVGGVKVRLDDERETAANDTIAVLAAQTRLHARDALIRHALHKTHVEADLVPLDDLRKQGVPKRERRV